jgi:hypothetical protein
MLFGITIHHKKRPDAGRNPAGLREAFEHDTNSIQARGRQAFPR